MNSRRRRHSSRAFRGGSLRVGLALCVASLFTLPGAMPVEAQQSGTARVGDDRVGGDVSVVYLVRHAERADDDPRDPSLSAEGRARVKELVRVVADVPFTTIFSTPFRRTRETADPVAQAHGLEVVEYDPTDPASVAAFVDTLAATPGHHLVSGHSNTTPAMVAALGGDPGAPIDHREYDRLYVVTVRLDGSVTTSLLRFGAPFTGAHAPEL